MLFRKLIQRLLAVLISSSVLVLLSLTMVSEISFGQGSVWSNPIRLSAKGQTSWFPDVKVDRSGTVHIVWASGFAEYAVIYHSAFHQDGTQEEPLEIRALYQYSGEVTRPTLFADAKGFLHMTYRDTQVYYSNVNASQAHSTRAWSPDKLISEGYFSEVQMDSKGRLHYIFTRNVITGSCPICYHIFYIWSDDGGVTWSKEADISRGPLGAAKPQLLIDKNDNLHLVYETGIGGSYGQLSDTDPTQVMYMSSYDNGLTWELPVQLNPFDMIAKNVTIGLDGNNRLVVVWGSTVDDSIFYQTSTNFGLSWSLPIRLPGVIGIWSEYHSRLDNYSMEVDSAGNLHLVLIGRIFKQATPTATNATPAVRTPTPDRNIPTPDGKTRLSVIHVTWDGRAWFEPETLVTYIGDAPEWPRIAVGLGNQLNVVWFVRAEKDIWAGGGDYTVWYSTKTINVRKLTPAVYPTVKPIQSTEVVQEVVVTPTPTLEMDVPEVVQEPSWKLVYKEMDYLSVAVLSALPVVFFVGLFALIARKLRR